MMATKYCQFLLRRENAFWKSFNRSRRLFAQSDFSSRAAHVRCNVSYSNCLPQKRFIHGGTPPKGVISTSLSDADYNKVADETLESLTELLEELSDLPTTGSEFDVSYSNGVITLKLSSSLGTYVINKQSPNKQIWLSSPKSGPKRYDFINGTWLYKYEERSLHDLLAEEIQDAFHIDVDFSRCQHSGSAH